MAGEAMAADPDEAPASARSRLRRRVERSLPRSVRDLPATERRRARLCVILPLLAAFAAACALVLQALLGRPQLSLVVTSVGLVVALLASRLVHWTGSVRVAGHSITAAFFALTTLSSVIVGGVGAPRAFVVALIPMLATLLRGWRSGIAWAVICAATAVGLGLLRAVAPHWLPPLPTTGVVGAHAATIVMFIVFGLVLIASYDRINSRVTAELELEQARLEEARREAAAAARLKAALVANVSHELRTPLNGILGSVELLRRGDLDASEQGYVSTIVAGGEALVRLIDDLLDASRLEAGGMTLDRAGFSLRRALGGTLRLLAPLADSRPAGVTLILHVEPDVADGVIGDSYRLGQVLTNLVANAIKFTEQGHVRVHVRVVDSKTRFEVTDTGCGIATEAIERLFGAFEQAGASTARDHGGSGLGLSIASRLVELMGGELRAESEPGVGSRFWFDLELDPDPDAEAERASRSRSVALELSDALERDAIRAGLEWRGHVVVDSAPDVVLHDGAPPAGSEVARVRLVAPSAPVDRSASEVSVPRPAPVFELERALERALARTSKPPSQPPARGAVLVADDVELNRAVLTAQLEHLGFEAVCVPSGEAALALVREGRRFVAALLDVNLGGLDGYETARAVREIETAAGAPPLALFALTGLDGQDHRERARRAGFDRFLVKPLRMHELELLLDDIRERPPSPVDEATWAELEALGEGDEEFLTTLVRGFVERAESQLEELQHTAEPSRIAHALRGSALQIGAGALAAVCRTVELDPERRDELLPDVSVELDRASRALLDRVSDDAATSARSAIAHDVSVVELTGHLTLEAVEAALSPLHDGLADGVSLVFDCTEMTGYDRAARSRFVEWHGAHRDRIARVAIVTDRTLWHVAVTAMSLASSTTMRAFRARAEAEAWATGASS